MSTDSITTWIRGQIDARNAAVDEAVRARMRVYAQMANQELSALTDAQFRELQARVIALDEPLRNWAASFLRDPRIQGGVGVLGQQVGRGAAEGALPWVVGGAGFIVTLLVIWRMIELKRS